MHTHTGPTPTTPGRWVIPNFGPPSVLEWHNFDSNLESTPPPQQSALIRVLISGITGADNLQRAGGYPHPNTSSPGFTPGYDFVGEVVSVNDSTENGEKSNPTNLQPGDLVTAMCMIGAHGSHITLPFPSVVKLPSPMAPATSWTFPELLKFAALPLNYMTAYGMLRRSDAKLPTDSQGEPASILIGSAAGGVGTAVAQLIHAFDLPITMYGTCSPSKAAYVRDTLGMIPINRLDGNVAEQVRKATPDGQGVDVAFDSCGSDHTLNEFFNATKETGQVVVFGIMGEIKKDGSGMEERDESTKFAARMSKYPRTSFFAVERTYLRVAREVWMQDFQGILAKVKEGKLSPVVSRLFRLSDVVQTNELLIKGTGVMGKMLIVNDAQLAEENGVM